jgi:putative cell wall-binding protein
MAAKMVPVVAAQSGTVGWMHDERGGNCCAMALRHDDGWESWYIHLNNDTPGTDDGLGWGFAPGIEHGVHVTKGQLIGYVGDSGNAEWTGSHLHFELHDPSGAPVNPYPHLVAAEAAGGGTLPRLAGSDRYATAAEISRRSFEPGVSRVYIASGLDFADALAGGPAAGINASPVLLLAPTHIPSVIQQELIRLDPQEIVVLGGPAAVGLEVEEQLGSFTEGMVRRLQGADRFSTAAAISADAFDPGVPVAFVANGTTFPDALAGAAVAGNVGAPVLLTQSHALHGATLHELYRLRPERIVVLGGTGAVSLTVEAELTQLATTGNVQRLSGADRFATAAAISRASYDPGVATVFVAAGNSFADALAGAPVAAIRGAPVLLTQRDAVPPATMAEIIRLAPSEIIVLGGTGAVSTAIDAQLAYLVGG